MPQAPCPYCGHIPSSPSVTRCEQCNGLFEPLSRQATQLAMGPWYVRDEARPFMPGFNATILKQQVDGGRVKADTIVRGPTTHQFWVRADQAPGLSRLLGKCHACSSAVSQSDNACPSCQADLSLPGEIDHLGLAYVDPADREQAWAEVNAKRNAAPPPAPAAAAKPKQSTKAKPAAESVVDPDLMKPVERQPEAAQPESEDLHPSDIAEDLWHAPPSPTSRRRKRKSSGPDPLVLVLGVLLLCMFAAGLVLLLTSGGNGADSDKNTANQNAKDGKPADAQAAAWVGAANAGKQARAGLEQIEPADVPNSLRPQYDQIAKLIADTADLEQDKQQNDPVQAKMSYELANDLTVKLKVALKAWQADQALTEANLRKQEVQKLRDKASAAQSAKWSPSRWGEAEASWAQALGFIKDKSYDKAQKALDGAESLYTMSLGHAESAQLALDAQKALVKAMGQSDVEGLKKFASKLVDRVNQTKAEGERLLEKRDYAGAEEAFVDAAESWDQAVKVAKLARFRKLYSYNAGYNAAGLLLGIASGDGVDETLHKELAKAYEQLALPVNPAASIKPGKDADYAQAAGRLVNDVREAIKKTHGEQVQACYHAGFQARIIGQTLKTKSLTDSQRKRIHQALTKLEELAKEAGWARRDLGKLVDTIRKANLNTALNTEPVTARSAWQKLEKLLATQKTALLIMEPADDLEPDLFPEVEGTQY